MKETEENCENKYLDPARKCIKTATYNDVDAAILKQFQEREM